LKRHRTYARREQGTCECTSTNFTCLARHVRQRMYSYTAGIYPRVFSRFILSTASNCAHHRSECHQLGVISWALSGTNLPIRPWDLTVLNKGCIFEENCGGDTNNILTHECFLLQRSVRNAHRFIAELTCSGAGKQSAHKVVGQSRQRKRSPLDPAALLPHLVQ
jgi:hypothetical protein